MELEKGQVKKLVIQHEILVQGEWAIVGAPGGEGHTPVILGQPGDEPLLGAVTLEILGFVLNPFQRTLQPMRMLLI